MLGSRGVPAADGLLGCGRTPCTALDGRVWRHIPQGAKAAGVAAAAQSGVRVDSTEEQALERGDAVRSWLDMLGGDWEELVRRTLRGAG